MSDPQRLVVASAFVGLGPMEGVLRSVELTYQTGEAPHFIDITEDVQKEVEDAELEWGPVHVFSMHTTAAVRLNENEAMLKRDAKDWLDKLAPRGFPYRHNDFELRTENMTPEESPNGHAHLQQMALGTAEVVWVVNGRLHLGRWQRLFLIELDGPRRRKVAVHMGGGYRRPQRGGTDGTGHAN